MFHLGPGRVALNKCFHVTPVLRSPGIEIEDTKSCRGNTEVFCPAGRDHKEHPIGKRDGKEQWKFAAGAAVTASPAVGAGRLVIGTQDGAVYCFGEKR